MKLNKSLLHLCYFFLSICIFLPSCESARDEIHLEGIIGFQELRSNVISIYQDSLLSNLTLSKDESENRRYYSFSWFHTRNTILSSTSSGSSDRSDRNYILEFDIHGSVIDTLFISDQGENIPQVFASPNDEYILFTSYLRADPNEFPFEGLSPMLSLSIFNTTKAEIEIKIDSVGRSPNVQINESPWLYDSNGFVFSIESYAQLLYNGEQINALESSEGVYLFNMESGQTKLLIPAGSKPIASPHTDEIGYLKDNSIRVFDLNSKKERILFEYEKDDSIEGMHWTPDGEYLYFVHKKNSFITNIIDVEEKLICVHSEEKINFNGFGLGQKIYTWK